MNGKENTLNSQNWHDNNPHGIQERVMHPEKIIVWCVGCEKLCRNTD